MMVGFSEIAKLIEIIKKNIEKKIMNKFNMLFKFSLMMFLLKKNTIKVIYRKTKPK